MVRRRTLGVAPGDGRIGRLGDGVEKHSVVSLLPIVDLLFFEIRFRGKRHSEALVGRWFGARVFYSRYFEQAFHGNAAGGTRALCLVAQEAHLLGRCRNACSILRAFRGGERLDDLGTEIPRWRLGRGVGPNIARPVHHRWSRHLVLFGQTSLVASAYFHLSAMAN